jgi:hypothetical protein
MSDLEATRVASARLVEILAKAAKLEVTAEELLGTRPARKLIARTSGAFGRCALRLGLLALLLAGIYVYARWPTQEVETVRTVLRRQVSLSATREVFPHPGPLPAHGPTGLSGAESGFLPLARTRAFLTYQVHVNHLTCLFPRTA